MAGFGNVSEYANADDAGQTWITQFRKQVGSSPGTADQWNDYNYFPGSPLANFYASTPLESAYVSANRGIYLPSVAPKKQFIKNITLMSGSSGGTVFSNRQQTLMLCDYLMYYPFIDTDSTDVQTMTQAVTLPRYDWGYVMPVSHGASSAGALFTMTYTNQDGVSGRVTPNQTIATASGGGQITYREDGQTTSRQPFLKLQQGDKGVKSIESVQFSVLGGGLIALVIVKPLVNMFIANECRRETSGAFNSFGSASSIDMLIHKPTTTEVQDGAVLGFITKESGGSITSSTFVGYIETLWN